MKHLHSLELVARKRVIVQKSLKVGKTRGTGPLSSKCWTHLGIVHGLDNCREMYSNNISGTIPKELGNLTMLVSLDLYLNNFTGPIPEELGRLSALRFL